MSSIARPSPITLGLPNFPRYSVPHALAGACLVPALHRRLFRNWLHPQPLSPPRNFRVQIPCRHQTATLWQVDQPDRRGTVSRPRYLDDQAAPAAPRIATAPCPGSRSSLFDWPRNDLWLSRGFHLLL